MNEELQGVKNELLSAIQELRAEQKVGEARLVGEIIDLCINNAIVSAKKKEVLIAGCSRAVSLATFGCSRWNG